MKENETVSDSVTSCENQKKIRHRKKQLYNLILKQMEFYFGDANLSKDRFLGGMIKEDPYVPLTVFLKFNKLKALTDNVDDIAKSLAKSDILKLSEDETKVCRITPVKERIDIDDCTVYVECLPPDIDHEWLQNIFLSFGSVSYVSIPRFKHNKKIKGFAFIEFEDSSSAAKCLEAFEEAGAKLLPGMNPDELCSISTFEDPKACSDTDAISDVFVSSELKNKTEPMNNPKVQKRKLSDSELSADEQTLKKKSKKASQEHESNTVTDNENNHTNIQESEIKHTSIINDNANVSGVETEDNETDNCNEMKKKKRKRKKQVKKYRDSIASTGLKILSKKEWKKLRNTYLDLQRNKMRQLKKQLHLNRVVEYQKNHPIQYQQNFYGGNDKNNSKITKDEMEPSLNPILEFTPGVIVSLKLRESCVDVKGFKAAIKNISDEIKYIDINEGATEAHLRFSENAFALKFSCLLEEASSIHTPDIVETINQISSQVILTGDAELEYWKKVAKDRDNKRNKKVKLEKRGKDKLIAKAVKNSHVHFDED